VRHGLYHRWRSGGTGTGAAPVVADVARAMGILTIAVVTRPSASKASGARSKPKRHPAAARQVDTLIVIPNDRLLTVAAADTSMLDAFKIADDVLLSAVRGVTDLITVPSHQHRLCRRQYVMRNAAPPSWASGPRRGGSRRQCRPRRHHLTVARGVN